MNETSTAARAWINPTEAEQRAETQIRRPSFRLISGLEYTAGAVKAARHCYQRYVLIMARAIKARNAASVFS